MLAHGAVFTSNYDLLLYWALMHEGNQGAPLKDLFWGDGRTFDELDTEVNNATPVYWLHGGVHLETLSSGVVRKRVGQGANLLDTFGGGAVPLMITEGTGNEKRKTIMQSPYLNHAFLELARHHDSVTIVGHSLNPASDGHIVDALKVSTPSRIAISIHQPEPGTVDELWGKVSGMFPEGGVDIHVFDAATHPACSVP